MRESQQSQFLCMSLLLVTEPPFLERRSPNWRRGQREWLPSCFCSCGSLGLELLGSPGASWVLSSPACCLSLFLLSEPRFTTCLSERTLRTFKVGERRRLCWCDGAAGLCDPDLSEVLVRFKTAYGKCGRVCVIPRINTLCLPRWLIFFFSHQLINTILPWKQTWIS